MCGHVFLGRFFRSMLNEFRGLHDALVQAFIFLFDNAIRSNPDRERQRGRLACGFDTVKAAC